MVNEIGAAMCITDAGAVTFGPWSEGTPLGVQVKMQCPPGTRVFGIFHTHPGGVAIPSERDWKSGIETDSEALCIDADGDVRCHRVADAPARIARRSGHMGQPWTTSILSDWIGTQINHSRRRP